MICLEPLTSPLPEMQVDKVGPRRRPTAERLTRARPMIPKACKSQRRIYLLSYQPAGKLRGDADQVSER